MTSAVSRGLALLPTVNVAQVWAAGDHSSGSAAHAAPFPSKLRTIGRKSTGTQEPPCAAPLKGVREKGSRPPQEHRQRERENPEAATASSAFQSPTMREMTATIDPARAGASVGFWAFSQCGHRARAWPILAAPGGRAGW
jgi:hypothetical protein